MRTHERDDLTRVLEMRHKPSVSRTQMQVGGSGTSVFETSTLPALVQRERTDMPNAKPFEHNPSPPTSPRKAHSRSPPRERGSTPWRSGGPTHTGQTFHAGAGPLQSA